VYVALIAAALVLEFGFLEGRADWYILNYYTLLSNIACLLFFAAGLKSGGFAEAWHPRAEGAITFCIAVTGIVYAALLAPADIAEGSFWTFENLVVHYVGPAMVVVDWLMFSPRGRIRATDPLLWLAMPLAYFGYVLVRSTFAGPIGGSGSRFPYDFIDPAVQGGWDGVMVAVAGMMVGMTALGYIIYGVDRVGARRRQQRLQRPRPSAR
jgi:hypothetical protein